jgi:hypothetical protein
LPAWSAGILPAMSAAGVNGSAGILPAMSATGANFRYLLRSQPVRFSKSPACFLPVVLCLKITPQSDLVTKRVFKTVKFLPAALIILCAALFTTAQQPSGSKQNTRPEIPAATLPRTTTDSNDNKTASFSYEFSQPEFYIRRIVIEHDANGRGKITFQRLNEEASIEEALELSPAVLERISALWQALKFLDSDTDYQSAKKFPHMGTMRITMQQDGRKRTAEFNWTNNKEASALVTEYRHLSDQAILVFDVSLARENQPLNAPKLMEQLEMMLKRGWLSDPQQLIPLLKEVSTDEHLPLIARNHALRLLKQLEK